LKPYTTTTLSVKEDRLAAITGIIDSIGKRSASERIRTMETISCGRALVAQVVKPVLQGKIGADRRIEKTEPKSTLYSSNVVLGKRRSEDRLRL